MCSFSFPQFWVEWFGDGTISLVEEETVRTLKEGLQHRKKSQKNKKLSKRLHEAVKEAFKAQKKQVETDASNSLVPRPSHHLDVDWLCNNCTVGMP